MTSSQKECDIPPSTSDNDTPPSCIETHPLPVLPCDLKQLPLPTHVPKDNVLLIADLPERPSWLRRPTLRIDSRDNAQAELLNESLDSPADTLRAGKLHNRLLVVLCGLPARGKTFIANKIGRYMNWSGVQSRVFNCAKYRAMMFGQKQKSSFFDYSNEDNLAKREEIARHCLKDSFAFFQSGGRLAVYNSQNVTKKERNLIHDIVIAWSISIECDVLWIEVICNDPQVVEHNVNLLEEFGSDQHKNNNDKFADDYRERIKYCSKAYEPIEDESISFVKFFTPNYKIVGNRVEGFVKCRLFSFLSNLRLVRHPLLISRHGESVANLVGHIGGDSGLSQRGTQYSIALGEFIAERQDELPQLKVWTSTLRRSIETAAFLSLECTQWPALGEISSGIFQGMTYEEIKNSFPEEFQARKDDKLRYRYPKGESYVDVMRRLEPIIFALERAETPVLLISHKAVLRCLCGYFFGARLVDIPLYEFPPHAVLELKPHPYGFEATRFELGVVHSEKNGHHTDS